MNVIRDWKKIENRHLSSRFYFPPNGSGSRPEGIFKIKWWMKNPDPKLFSARFYPIMDKNNTELTHDPRDLEYPLLQIAFPGFSQSHPASALCSQCGLASGSSWNRSCAQRGTSGCWLLLCSPGMEDQQHSLKLQSMPTNVTDTTYHFWNLAMKI